MNAYQVEIDRLHKRIEELEAELKHRVSMLSRVCEMATKSNTHLQELMEAIKEHRKDNLGIFLGRYDDKDIKLYNVLDKLEQEGK